MTVGEASMMMNDSWRTMKGARKAWNAQDLKDHFRELLFAGSGGLYIARICLRCGFQTEQRS